MTRRSDDAADSDTDRESAEQVAGGEQRSRQRRDAVHGSILRRRGVLANQAALPNKHQSDYNSPMTAEIRILFVADSHIGFDLPQRPRVDRHRRGHDFLANYHAALGPAMRGEVDVVIHGGDVFDRSRPVPSTAYQALEPLRRVAASGVPVFVVPGNHERSRIPHTRFALHPNVHLFDRPRSFTLEIRGYRIVLSGFPYERDNVRARFPDLLHETGWAEHEADSRLLCIHHCVEGATVGPADFTFTTAADVIRLRDIPSAFRAVLSGHIHRHQVLTRDLSRRKIPTPVLYPGSIERTSLAEFGEPKGFMIVSVRPDGMSWEFRQLPTRELEITALRPRTSSATAAKLGRPAQNAPRRHQSPVETSFLFPREEIEPAARAR